MRILNLPWPPGLLGDSSQCALSLSVPPRVPSKHSRHLCLGRISSIAAARDNGIARSLVLHAVHCRGGRDAGRVLGRVSAVLPQQLHQVCSEDEYFHLLQLIKWNLSNANIDSILAMLLIILLVWLHTLLIFSVTTAFFRGLGHAIDGAPSASYRAHHLAAFTMAAATMPSVDAFAPNTISPAPIARPRSWTRSHT